MSTTAASLPKAGLRRAPARTAPVGRDVNRIKLSWLLTLRWVAVVGQSLAISLAKWGLDIDVPVVPLAALVAFQMVANAALEVWLRSGVVTEATVGGAIVLDVVVLSIALALSGGYWNPFATQYLVHVALAAVLLDASWAWLVLAVSLALFGGLFALEHVGALHLVSRLGRTQIESLHVQGMWVAFSVSAGLLVYIVQRVQRALTDVERALARERGLSARKDKVASLATFAAGAAHELSTPLSTIAVVVKELQRMAERDREVAPPEVQDDLRLIREQVDRCRDILHQMSAHAGENAGEPFVALTLEAWVDAALAHVPHRDRVDVRAAVDLAAYAVRGPPRGLTRALRSLVKNALQASPEPARVGLQLSASGGFAVAAVIDEGPGMPADVLDRAGEPFFTTKIPGEGMGLGLFLTQTLAAQLGGTLELRSTPGHGTTAMLRLPTVPDESKKGEAT